MALKPKQIQRHNQVSYENINKDGGRDTEDYDDTRNKMDGFSALKVRLNFLLHVLGQISRRINQIEYTN